MLLNSNNKLVVQKINFTLCPTWSKSCVVQKKKCYAWRGGAYDIWLTVPDNSPFTDYTLTIPSSNRYRTNPANYPVVIYMGTTPSTAHHFKYKRKAP